MDLKFNSKMDLTTKPQSLTELFFIKALKDKEMSSKLLNKVDIPKSRQIQRLYKTRIF